MTAALLLVMTAAATALVVPSVAAASMMVAVAVAVDILQAADFKSLFIRAGVAF